MNCKWQFLWDASKTDTQNTHRKGTNQVQIPFPILLNNTQQRWFRTKNKKGINWNKLDVTLEWTCSQNKVNPHKVKQLLNTVTQTRNTSWIEDYFCEWTGLYFRYIEFNIDVNCQHWYGYNYEDNSIKQQTSTKSGGLFRCKKIKLTRMHSSSSSHVYPSMHWAGGLSAGGCLPRGLPWGVSAQGGVYPSMHWGRHPPCGQNDRQV